MSSVYTVSHYMQECIVYNIYIYFSFEGVKWKLVSPRYLKKATSPNAVSSWRNFLVKLGVQNVIAVRQFNDKIPKVSLTQLAKTITYSNLLIL